jgi:hypothetical protein
MPNNSKKKPLKGIRLYNYLLKELGNQNDRDPNQQKLSIAAKRKIVSQQLYPKFKTQEKVLVSEIKRDLRTIVKALPPKEVCNPLLLPEQYLAAVEYYEIDKHISNFLPDCLDVRVNAGFIGKTRIFNTSNYNYYSNGVADLIDDIRDYLEGNDSGVAYFYGIVKLKPRKKNNGDPINYFVDYVLTINDTPQDNFEGIDYERTKKEEKAAQSISGYFQGRFKELQKDKRKRARASKKAKSKKPENLKINESVKKALDSLKIAYEAGAFSKVKYEVLRDEIKKGKK